MALTPAPSAASKIPQTRDFGGAEVHQTAQYAKRLYGPDCHMRHHNIDGVQDSRRFEAIQTNYEFEAGRIATTNQELQQMIAELSAKHLPFAKECFVEAACVNRLTIPLLVAARMELESSISKEQYAEILHQALSKHGGQLDEFIQNIAAANAAAPTS